ncbi:MAG: carbamate kinase [Planctomycetes bacterium]|nr:carbamate kinase [Planctomycetota bacterium]
MKDDGPIVIALGGNAISRENEEGNITQQFQRTRQTVALLADVIEAGHHLVITHGNGPQVGNVLRRVELAAKEVYPLPLDICGADTQGGMGYMIAQCLNNELRQRGIARTVTAIITMTEVAPDDPAFHKPTKPIGGHYERELGEQMQKLYGWQMVETSTGRLRRVVPSPIPVEIVEINLIRRLARAGELLVVCGGGGIPVTRNDDGDLIGIEAVIDKDRSAALLANAVEASTLLIATSVEGVALDFATPTQRFVDRMTVSEARQHLADKQFPAGSMGPKVGAALDFLERSSHASPRVIISALQQMADALAGKAGTRIERD